MNRVPLWLKLLAVVSLLALAGVVLSVVPSGDVATAPHAPIELTKPGTITIDGRPTEPAHGHLYIVAVNERRVSLLERWLLSIDTSHKVTFSKADPTVSEKLQTTADRHALVASKKVAAASAFRLLGERVRYTGSGAIVVRVDPKGAAARVVEQHDIIVRIDGQTVHTMNDIIDHVARLQPGDIVKLGIRRDGRPVIATIAAAAAPAGSATRARLGLNLNTVDLGIHLPKKVVYRTGKVLGPSAGLAFALAVYDAESTTDLLAGRYVVATGELAIDGSVLEIGGMRQKAISATERAADGKPIADLMLVPTGNVKEAVATVKEFCKGASPTTNQCPHVLGVSSVKEAVQDLQLQRQQLSTRYAV